MPSKIEWTDETWNPITGCTKISTGCKNCYAERMAKRLAGRCGYPADDPFRPTFHENRLTQPLHWDKPRKIFVCSMGDLFVDIPPPTGSWPVIDRILMIADRRPQHTFLLLTKRIEAAWYYFNSPIYGSGIPRSSFLKKNVWLGVTAENQEQANRRIPILLQIPAAVRFVSVEPMLGPVDLTNMDTSPELNLNALTGVEDICEIPAQGPKLDLVICGGESGPKARPMHPDWPRALRDQCQAAGVPFFFKQFGEWAPRAAPAMNGNQIIMYPDGHIIERPSWRGMIDTRAGAWIMDRLGKKKAGRTLDGKTWDEWPETK